MKVSDLTNEQLDYWVAKADTPQRAICLAVLASVYGEEVSDES